MKKKIILQNSFEIPNYGIGFSTSFVDYRLVWEVSQVININPVKLSDKIFHDKKTREDIALSVYYFKTLDIGKLFIIKLKYDGISIIPGLKNFDFILISDYTEVELKSLLSNLIKLNIQGGSFLLQLKENHKSILKKIIF